MAQMDIKTVSSLKLFIGSANQNNAYLDEYSLLLSKMYMGVQCEDSLQHAANSKKVKAKICHVVICCLADH